MITRYINPVLNITGGETVLATTERYLGNDRNIDVTAKDLAVHPNTVRQRLDRFDHEGVIGVGQRHQLLRRKPSGKGSEAREVGEHYGDLAPLPAQSPSRQLQTVGGSHS